MYKFLAERTWDENWALTFYLQIINYGNEIITKPDYRGIRENNG